MLLREIEFEMVRRRAPSCEVDGINKGSWTPEEDTKLVAYVQKHGHDNWRALPKLAGLKRCGKSCRLRWVNYLRPDVKRGNFTEEEEMTIIRLHESLGNKWSMIAAHLHGRTDNEIKNVWHTHLKKRVEGRKPKNSPRRKAKRTATSSSNSSGTVDDTAGTSSTPAKLSDHQLMLPNCSSLVQYSDDNTNHDSNHENANLSKDHIAADRCTEEERSSVTESWSNSSSSETSAMLHELRDASWSTPQCAGDAYVNASLQDVLEIPCDSTDLDEIWGLMDDDCCVLAPAPDQVPTPMAEDGVPCFDDISAEACNRESIWDAEKSIWLAYLENELDL